MFEAREKKKYMNDYMHTYYDAGTVCTVHSETVVSSPPSFGNGWDPVPLLNGGPQ